MLEQLRLSGFDPEKGEEALMSRIIAGCAAELTRMNSRYADHVPALDDAQRIVYEAIGNGIQELRALVASKMGIERLSLQQAEQMVPYIVDSFAKGHPVSDQWKEGDNYPLEARWLLLAFWETYLRQQQDVTVPLAELRRYESDLASQFSRAINAAEVLSRWRDANGRFNR